jgi:uncharacterized protein
VRIHEVTSLAAVEPAAWNALAGTQSPFLRHEFLSALESTGCVGGKTGWEPMHLVAFDGEGSVAGAVPAYLKQHSWGEFVFDFSWAQAYSRHGLPYYPKLLAGVPFSPVTGPRLLVRPGAGAGDVADLLAGALVATVRRRGLSSAHALFVGEDDRARLGSQGWLLRRDCQFHWTNRGYRTFDDYLATFTAEKRKKAKRERRRCEEAGIRFLTLSGRELTPELLDVVYDLHRINFLRHGHEPYLSRAFFTQVAASLGDALMVKLAVHGDLPVAAAIFFWSADALYGRYWGSREEFHSLHFETCYHQGIEFCIERGIARFEPGTQGEHKLSRGFEPTFTWSAHWIDDPRFRDAIGDFVAREGEAVAAYRDETGQHTPFKRP